MFCRFFRGVLNCWTVRNNWGNLFKEVAWMRLFCQSFFSLDFVDCYTSRCGGFSSLCSDGHLEISWPLQGDLVLWDRCDQPFFFYPYPRTFLFAFWKREMERKRERRERTDEGRKRNISMREVLIGCLCRHPNQGSAPGVAHICTWTRDEPAT